MRIYNSMKIHLIPDLYKRKLISTDYNTIENNAKDKIILQSDYIQPNENLFAQISCFSETSDEKIVILTDTDESICRWKEKNVPVIAWSHEENRDESLMGTSWMILDIDALTYDYLKEVCHRYDQIPLTILSTERSYLRELSKDDFTNLILLDEEQEPNSAGRFFPVEYHSVLQTKSDALEKKAVQQDMKIYLEQYIQNQYPFYGYGIYGCYDRNTKEFLGIAGFSMVDLKGNLSMYDVLYPENHSEQKKITDSLMEIGYAVKKSVRRKGYACEWVSALMDYAHKKQEKEEWESGRIITRIAPTNLASIRVAQKCHLPILFL